MIRFSTAASALFILGALATPSFAAPGDAGSGQTMGATKSNDAGSGPTQGAASNPANAPTPTSPQGTNAQNTPGGGMRIAQKMRDDLTKAGFTDIHIMPSSFLVRAKDSSGNPVMMVVNPDSITAITEQGGTNAASGSMRPGSTGTQPNAPGAAQTKP
jgi:hypothetical protein